MSGTREAILAAASRHFAHYGYDRASFRRIAAEAGVDPKLIAHFFGSKQHLFVAAIGLPLNPAEVLPSILTGDPAAIGGRLAELLVDVLQQPELHQPFTAVVRAAASEPEVARMMREFLTREVFLPVAELLGTDDAQFRLNLVGSQIVGLVMARYIVAVEPLASMPPEMVAAAVAPTLQRYLIGPLSSDDRPAGNAESPRVFDRSSRWRAPSCGRISAYTWKLIHRHADALSSASGQGARYPEKEVASTGGLNGKVVLTPDRVDER